MEEQEILNEIAKLVATIAPVIEDAVKNDPEEARQLTELFNEILNPDS